MMLYDAGIKLFQTARRSNMFPREPFAKHTKQWDLIVD
jgi:hypothetical protein